MPRPLPNPSAKRSRAGSKRRAAGWMLVTLGVLAAGVWALVGESVVVALSTALARDAANVPVTRTYHVAEDRKSGELSLRASKLIEAGETAYRLTSVQYDVQPLGVVSDLTVLVEEADGANYVVLSGEPARRVARVVFSDPDSLAAATSALHRKVSVAPRVLYLYPFCLIAATTALAWFLQLIRARRLSMEGD